MEIRIKRRVSQIGTLFDAEVNDGKVKATTGSHRVFRCPYKAVASVLTALCRYYEDQELTYPKRVQM